MIDFNITEITNVEKDYINSLIDLTIPFNLAAYRTFIKIMDTILIDNITIFNIDNLTLKIINIIDVLFNNNINFSVSEWWCDICNYKTIKKFINIYNLSNNNIINILEKLFNYCNSDDKFIGINIDLCKYLISKNRFNLIDTLYYFIAKERNNIINILNQLILCNINFDSYLTGLFIGCFVDYYDHLYFIYKNKYSINTYNEIIYNEDIIIELLTIIFENFNNLQLDNNFYYGFFCNHNTNSKLINYRIRSGALHIFMSPKFARLNHITDKNIIKIFYKYAISAIS